MYRIFGKRLLDMFFSALGLIILSPLFPLVALLIKLDSMGPVFFRQKRMGQGGQLFYLLKFRTMISDKQKEANGFEPGSFQRVTRVGKFLRKTKLDEIPQLVNVLIGDMSLVGPRPEVERYSNFYSEKFADVLSVRPGITDSASIKYRNEEQILSQSHDPQKTYQEIILPDKLEIARAYVKSNVSFWGDVHIIAQTFLSILKGGQ